MGESTRGWVDLDDYDPGAFDEATRLVDELEAAKDLRLAAELRDATESQQLIHGVKLQRIRAIGRMWLREHHDEDSTFVLSLAEVLWGTNWREERILALFLMYCREDLRFRVEWSLVERWSTETDSIEIIDYLGALAAFTLSRTPNLIGRVRRLVFNESPLSRRLGLVTLIVASREYAWRPALKAMVDSLEDDSAPEVQGLLPWAKRRIQ